MKWKSALFNALLSATFLLVADVARDCLHRTQRQPDYWAHEIFFAGVMFLGVAAMDLWSEWRRVSKAKAAVLADKIP